MSRTITYALHDGELPAGLRISSSGNIRGEIAYSNVFPAPLWDTPTQMLADYEEYDTITPIQLTATSQVEPAGLTYNLVEEYKEDMGLPWGLQLNYNTGVISGTIDKLRSSDGATWPPEETPIWNTPSGRLVDIDELTSTTLTLSVTSFDSRPLLYSTVGNGGLPWGITLSNSGVISGTAERLLVGSNVVFTPKPTWVTREGTLGNVTTGFSFSRALEALPNLGTSLTYDIVNGGLPWGLKLSASGNITGVSNSDPKAGGILDTIPNPPTFSNNNTIVITAKPNQVIDYDLVIVPYGTRTITFVGVVNKPTSFSNLPWGLINDKCNIVGTVSGDANIGIYDIQIVAYDSEDAKATFNFKIEIEAL